MWFSFQQPFVGGALRDATKNGCVGDYKPPGLKLFSLLCNLAASGMFRRFLGCLLVSRFTCQPSKDGFSFKVTQQNAVV